MKAENTKRILKHLKLILDKDRYEHTVGVMYMSAALAMRYEYDIQKAQVAGLLHDCAKCISNDKKLLMCKKHNIDMTEAEKANPFLLHAKLGAFLAMQKYHVHDMEIINAILNHTTGRPGMTMLDKIIYVADYIEPNRVKAPDLDYIRKMAFVDLDQTVFRILGDTLSYLESTSNQIDPMTRKAFEYYKNRLKEGKEK